MREAAVTRIISERPRWIVAAGGAFRALVTKVRTVGANLNGAEGSSEHYWANADAVLRYLLKYTDMETGEALGLAQFGEAGKVVGKRVGFTQNLSGNRQF